MSSVYILVLLGGILFTAAMSANNWDFTKLSTSKYETNTYNVSSEFRDISIDTSTADIAFSPSEDDECKVCYETEKEHYSVDVKNGMLTIELVDEREWYEHFGINFSSPRITVYLPETDYNSLLLKASTGDVEGGLLTEKVFVVESDTGSIDVPKTTTGGKCEITTDTGDITLTTGNGRLLPTH